MNKLKILAMVVLTTGLFLGCNKEEAKTGVQGVENYMRDNDLQGKFWGSCEESGLLGIRSRTALSFSGAKFKLEKAFFAESECAKEVIGSAIYQGVFKLDEEKYQGTDVKTIEIAVDKAQVEIRSEGLATVASGVKYCGVASYEVGSVYDVTPNTEQANCFVTVVPVTFYGSYRISKIDKGTYLKLSETDVSKFSTNKSGRNFNVEPDFSSGYTKDH